MEREALEQYFEFLDSNKEQYGLVAYRLMGGTSLEFTMKKGCEQNIGYLFSNKLRPEFITGSHAVTENQ